MKDTNKTAPATLLTLQEAAKMLGVPVEVLLQWNDNHILTPRITRTGQIGYTQEQITQFLAIRSSLQNAQQPFQTATTPYQPQLKQQTPTVPVHAPIDYSAQNHRHVPEVQEAATSPRSFVLVVLSAGVLFAVVFASQQANLASLAHRSEQKLQSSQAQAKQSDAQLKQAISLNKTNKLAENADSDHLHTEDQGVFAKNIFVTPTPTLSPTPVTQTRRALASSSSAESKSVQAKHPLSSPIASVEAVIDDTSTLAEKTTAPCPSCDETQSPDTALKLGKAPDTTNLLTTALGESPVTNSYPQQKLSTVTSQAVFFVFGSLGLLLLLAERQRRRHLLHVAPAMVGHHEAVSEKILEINQKMDGTVVLTFKGKDYKVSKPELDSDSDRFIERLMQLMQPGMQELEYESINDVLHLTTPLSRIVTRLGFVGVKRDLFFPRTSKHRVLFRKYITTNDLVAMNMTIAQLQKALDLPTQG